MFSFTLLKIISKKTVMDFYNLKYQQKDLFHSTNCVSCVLKLAKLADVISYAP